MFNANRRFILRSFEFGTGTIPTSAPRRSAVVSAVYRRAGGREFIWPVAAILMLIAVVWALTTDLRLPDEQRAALFAVQSQAYP
jgi:hypothetical protein